jgi:hypothetical protein
MVVGNGGSAVTGGVADVDKMVRLEEFGRHLVERAPRLSVFDQEQIDGRYSGLRNPNALTGEWRKWLW